MDSLFIFKGSNAKVTASVLVFAIIFVFGGILRVAPYVKAAAEPLPVSCKESDNEAILDLLNTLNRLSNALRQATGSSNPQDLQRIIQQFTDALNRLSSLTGQKTDGIKQCAVDVKKAVQDIQIPGITSPKGDNLPKEFGQIIGEFNKIIDQSEDAIDEIENSILGPIQETVKQINDLIQVVLDFQNILKTVKDVLSALIDSNPLLAFVLDPVIAVIVGILDPLAFNVLSVLTHAQGQVQDFAVQVQSAVNEIHTQTLLKVKAIIGSLDVAGFEKSINSVSKFCLSSQNAVSSANAFLGSAGGAFGGLVERMGTVNIPNVTPTPSSSGSGTSGDASGDLEDAGDDLASARSQAEDDLDDFNDVQGNLARIGQIFDGICGSLTRSSSQTLSSLKQGQVNSADVERLVEKIKEVEKGLVNNGIANINVQFQPQLDSAVLTLGNLKSLIAALGVSSAAINRKINEIESRLNQLRDASEIMESYSEELEQENVQRKFGEFTLVVNSTAGDLLLVVEGLKYILSQLESYVPTPLATPLI